MSVFYTDALFGCLIIEVPGAIFGYRWFSTNRSFTEGSILLKGKFVKTPLRHYNNPVYGIGLSGFYTTTRNKSFVVTTKLRCIIQL